MSSLTLSGFSLIKYFFSLCAVCFFILFTQLCFWAVPYFCFYIWFIKLNCSLIFCDRTTSVPQYVCMFLFGWTFKGQDTLHRFRPQILMWLCWAQSFQHMRQLPSTLLASYPGSGIRQFGGTGAVRCFLFSCWSSSGLKSQPQRSLQTTLLCCCFKKTSSYPLHPPSKNKQTNKNHKISPFLYLFKKDAFFIFYRFYIFVLFYPVGDEDVCCLGVYFAIATVALAGPVQI